MRIRLALVLFMMWSVLTGHGMRQSSSDPRPLDILVRDIGGTPLEDVLITLYHPPTMKTIDQETERDGVAHFMAAPGNYLLLFQPRAGQWSFISDEDQNAGAMTSGNVGGFALYLDPESPSYSFQFVVVRNEEHRLVPLVDISEGAIASPEPYTYDGRISDEVMNKAPEMPPLVLEPLIRQPASSQATAPAGGQGQATQTADTAPGGGWVGLIVAAIVSGLAVVTMWAMIFAQARQESSKEEKKRAE
jgi:hypothetical protein